LPEEGGSEVENIVPPKSSRAYNDVAGFFLFCARGCERTSEKF